MDMQRLQAQVAEFDRLDAEQESSLSKSAYRSWTHGQTYVAGFTARTQLKNIMAKMAAAAQPATTWRDLPVTGRQLECLARMGVSQETGITRGRASDLIDAAKNEALGSIGGGYDDGSN